MDINRRKFLTLSAAGAAVAGGAALNIGHLSHAGTLHAKEVFIKHGMCSHTFMHILNREFGFPNKPAELASDPLAGGLMSTQNQCGMLWGASLAAGAEAYRRYDNKSLAMAAAIYATQHIMNSFEERATSVNCSDIACDFSNAFEMVSFMLKSLPGGFGNIICMNLAEKWAPEAVDSAQTGLAEASIDSQPDLKNCTAEIAHRLGATDEEMIMVSGLAGGMGLSGNGCGALGTAIWLKSLDWCRKNPGKSGSANPELEELLNAFYNASGSEISCKNISGKTFLSLEDHSQYVKNNGCSGIIKLLSS